MSLASVDLCTVPAANSPDGQYNFKNPETLGPAIICVGVILCVISSTLTIGRIYVNRRRLFIADYFTIAACLFNIGFTGIQLSSWRMYRHQWNIPVCWFTPSYFKTLFVQECFFAPVYITSKTAIFLLYRQVFAVKKRMKAAINFGICITFLLYFVNIPLAAIYSAPRVGGSWSSILTSDGPKKMIPWSIVMAAVSVLLDFYIFLLPIPTIVGLQMPLRRRIQVVAVFATALVGVIASVLSLAYRVMLLNTNDELWPQSIVSLCALIESNVAIIVGCMPAFAQLLRMHVAGSAIFRSLRSRLRGIGSSGESNRLGDNNDKNSTSKLGPRAGPLPSRWENDSLELSDTNLIKSQITALDNETESRGLSHITVVRSVEISQHWSLDVDRAKHMV